MKTTNRSPECVTDIETVPVTDPELIEEITKKIVPPGNYTKEETIKKWEEETKPQLVADAVSKTSLDGTYGRICCIGWAFDDDRVHGVVSRDEVEVIETFFDACIEHYNKIGNGTNFTMVGHGISGFDLRFMWQRAIINRVKIPAIIPWFAKPWDEHMKDTMVMWNPGQDKRISLHVLCKVLGIQSPKDANGISGADIARLWEESRRNKSKMDTIKHYCMDDVIAERDCYRVLTGRNPLGSL